MFNDKLSTVWSAPNYLYRFGFYFFINEIGNLASILEIDENLNNYFNIFSDSPDNLRKDFGGAKPV